MNELKKVTIEGNPKCSYHHNKMESDEISEAGQDACKNEMGKNKKKNWIHPFFRGFTYFTDNKLEIS